MKNDTQVSGSGLLGHGRDQRAMDRAHDLVALAAMTLGAHAQSGATLEEAMANERAKRVKPAPSPIGASLRLRGRW